MAAFTVVPLVSLRLLHSISPQCGSCRATASSRYSSAHLSPWESSSRRRVGILIRTYCGMSERWWHLNAAKRSARWRKLLAMVSTLIFTNNQRDIPTFSNLPIVGKFSAFFLFTVFFHAFMLSLCEYIISVIHCFFLHFFFSLVEFQPFIYDGFS